MRSIATCLFMLCALNVFSQAPIDSLLGKLDPEKLAASVSERSKKLEDKLAAKSMKVLADMQRQEEKLYKKMLGTKDSLIARSKLEEVKAKYAQLHQKLTGSQQGSGNTYIPRLDSLSTSLRFLDPTGANDKIKTALVRAGSLKDKFNQAEEIRRFIKERREQLKTQLEKLGLVKDLKKINKQVYYYTAQIKEYKEILNDPKKIEKKALELLSKTKLWKDFFRKNSMLASLFRIPNPDEPLNMADFAGLQTRVEINGLIQQQVQNAGANGQQQFQQNIQAAQSHLNQLKNKLGKFGGGNSDDIMAEGFRPNGQKTKSFLQRLELGTNLQTQKANGYFPTTSDIGLSLGYKLNDRSVIGVGASYKMGWGRGWNDITITHQGLGLRGFIDWKIKGSFWVSGGFEQNYKSAFDNLSQLQNGTGWQKSGLLGLSKSIPVKTKFFKKTKVQLLWDFLSYEQIPKTQPIIFRIGYQFK